MAQPSSYTQDLVDLGVLLRRKSNGEWDFWDRPMPEVATVRFYGPHSPDGDVEVPLTPDEIAMLDRIRTGVRERAVLLLAASPAGLER